MRFIVREGFVVHDKKMIEVGGAIQIRESSYFQGDEVDFDEDTANQHLHKMEPLDKEARKFVEAKFPTPVPVAQAPGVIDYAALAEAIVSAQVAAALAYKKAEGAADTNKTP